MSPEDLQLLASLCDPDSPVDFAARPDLAAFLDRPDVQAQLTAILTIRDIRYNAQLQAANIQAIATLQQVIAETEDLTEKRRAATSILRTVRTASARDRRGHLGASPRAHTTTTFRAPRGMLDTAPAAPQPDIPARFKRLNTFVYSDIPTRSLSPRQAVANALALLQQGDSDSLQSLFNHCTHRARFQTRDPADFEKLARERFQDELQFQAAFAAPLIQPDRQSARQDVLIIPQVGSTPGDPIAFTIHLTYRMFGQHECCWLISHFTARPPTTPTEPTPSAPEPNTS